jgi:hypothetical protein
MSSTVCRATAATAFRSAPVGCAGSQRSRPVLPRDHVEPRAVPSEIIVRLGPARTGSPCFTAARGAVQDRRVVLAEDATSTEEPAFRQRAENIPPAHRSRRTPGPREQVPRIQAVPPPPAGGVERGSVTRPGAEPGCVVPPEIQQARFPAGAAQMVGASRRGCRVAAASRSSLSRVLRFVLRGGRRLPFTAAPVVCSHCLSNPSRSPYCMNGSRKVCCGFMAAPINAKPAAAVGFLSGELDLEPFLTIRRHL